MDNLTKERIVMAEGQEGGIQHLLRLTRSQCRASVAFVALRNDHGTIDITAVPMLTEESEWTHDALQGVVAQTLRDPFLGEGRAVIRVSEVFRRNWPGERQSTRMAVAPLADAIDQAHPWGLLCALDPTDGQFSESDLDMLGRLAVRVVNHLHARKRVLGDLAGLGSSFGEEALLPKAKRVTVPDDLVISDLGDLYEDRFAAGSQHPETKMQIEPDQELDSEPTASRLEDPGEESPINPEESAMTIDIHDAAFVAEALADVAPELMNSAKSLPPRAVDAAAVPTTSPADAPAPQEPTATAAIAVRTPAQLRLLELVDELEVTTAKLSQAGQPAALLLVELSVGGEYGSTTEEEVAAAGARLLEIARYDDQIFRIGSALLAGIMTVRPGSTDLSAMRTRLVRAVAQGASSQGREVSVRSTVVRIDPGHRVSGEDLVFAAMRQFSAA